jgi:glycerate kinase
MARRVVSRARRASVDPSGATSARRRRIVAVDSIDASALKSLPEGLDVSVLCDVTNPLVGPNGAARVFGPQKGADPAMVEQLDANLAYFAAIIRRDLGIEIADIAGGGAAGGLGAGLVAFLNAKLAPGGETIIGLLGYEQQLAGVDLVITGEGKLDVQTSGGKAVQSIARTASRAGVPVVALPGTLDADSAALNAMGIRAAWSIVPGPCTLDEAITHGGEWLARSATELGNLLALTGRGPSGI